MSKFYLHSKSGNKLNAKAKIKTLRARYPKIKFKRTGTNIYKNKQRLGKVAKTEKKIGNIKNIFKKK